MEDLPNHDDELSTTLLCIGDVFSVFAADYVGCQQPLPGVNGNGAVTEDATVDHSVTNSAHNVAQLPQVPQAADATSSEDQVTSEGPSTPGPSPIDEKGDVQPGRRKRKRGAMTTRKKNLTPCGNCRSAQKKCTPSQEDPTCERCRAKGLVCPPHVARKKSREESASEPTYKALNNSPFFGVIDLKTVPAERPV